MVCVCVCVRVCGLPSRRRSPVCVHTAHLQTPLLFHRSPVRGGGARQASGEAVGAPEGCGDGHGVAGAGGCALRPCAIVPCPRLQKPPRRRIVSRGAVGEPQALPLHTRRWRLGPFPVSLPPEHAA